MRFLGAVTSGDTIDFVMEIAEGGTLDELLSDAKSADALRADTKRAARLLQGVLIALDHLHSHDFVHCDVAARMLSSLCCECELCSGNVLLSCRDPRLQIAKLADWGLTRMLVAGASNFSNEPFAATIMVSFVYLRVMMC